MKCIMYMVLFSVSVLLSSCANADKQNTAQTSSSTEETEVTLSPEMQEKARQLADDMCAAKRQVATTPDQPEEYEVRTKELNDKLSSLERELSTKEEKILLNNMVTNMTSDCVR